MHRTDFKDRQGNIVASVHCENSDFLLAIENRVIGTWMPTGDEESAWVASAVVTDDNGVHVAEYELFPERVRSTVTGMVGETVSVNVPNRSFYAKWQDGTMTLLKAIYGSRDWEEIN